MKRLDNLRHFQVIVDIQYQQKMEVFSKILQQEADLRSTIAKLNQYHLDSRNSNDQHQKAIGADILWQSWIGKKQTEVNLQLSQVLAKKSIFQEQVQISYGKKNIVSDLMSLHTKETKRKNLSIQLSGTLRAMRK